jgi:ferric-dicitrate binding protein FerR (iron transport regulator)
MKNMIRLLDTLKALIRADKPRDIDSTAVEDILQRTFTNVRDADPETRQQWARLQGSLAQNAAAVVAPRPRLVPRIAIAVAVLALAAIGVSLYFTSAPPALDVVSTGRGEQQQIILADGSEVRLHHTTELIVSPMQAGKPRHVSLKGEGFFRVRRNDTPFIITTDQASVEVLGTEFNVRSRKDAVEVAVIGGRVKVRSVAAAYDSAIVLTQNQMAVSHSNEAPRFIGTIPSHEYPGWMSGKLFLNKTPFADACREIELRFNVTIALSNARASSMAITGILEATTPALAVAALCELTGTQHTRKGDTFEVF